MSDSTPPDLVSVELERADWDHVREVLNRGGQGSAGPRSRSIAGHIGRQLPPLAPTGFGALILADVRGLGQSWLVLADPGAEWPWRTFGGDWFRPDQFKIIHIESPGVCIP